MLATIGAAPVPVPPPMPAVTKTMSAPTKAFANFVLALQRGVTPDFRFRAGAQAASPLRTDLNLIGCMGPFQMPGRPYWRR